MVQSDRYALEEAAAVSRALEHQLGVEREKRLESHGHNPGADMVVGKYALRGLRERIAKTFHKVSSHASSSLRDHDTGQFRRAARARFHCRAW